MDFEHRVCFFDWLRTVTRASVVAESVSLVTAARVRPVGVVTLL